MMSCDVVLVGVGGQGVLTIGDLLVQAAFAADVPASFCPTKGMAQRGGFVKVEVRLGAAGAGPRIGAKSADVVVAMERSEALQGIPFIMPGGSFLLYDHAWEPTGVQLGLDAYPTLDAVSGAIKKTGARLAILNASDLPEIDGRSAAANIFLLGAILGVPRMAELLEPDGVEAVIAARWPKAAEANVQAFRYGLNSVGGSFR